MNQSSHQRILVTGFEPFDGEKLNPTEMVLKALPDAIEDISIRKLLLPVEFKRSVEQTLKAIEEISPDGIIMLGQAGGRSAITPESTARNEMNARIPDNAGYQPEHLPVVEGGPEIYRSTLPLETIIREIRDLGIPCERSEDAGAYVCNALFYGILNHLDGRIPAGFIHVPYICEQGHEDKPFMDFENILQAVTIAIRCLA